MEDLRPIKDKKTISFYLKAPWYFDKFFDKFILIILTAFGLWKILGLLWRIF